MPALAMQWNSEAQAGITTGEPWLKANPNYHYINVEQDLSDPNSIFYYYQKLIRHRKSIPAVVYGSYDLILPEHEQIYAFTRTLENERLIIILNFSAGEVSFVFPIESRHTRKELLIANYPLSAEDDRQQFSLRPYEARVYRQKF